MVAVVCKSGNWSQSPDVASRHSLFTLAFDRTLGIFGLNLAQRQREVVKIGPVSGRYSRSLGLTAFTLQSINPTSTYMQLLMSKNLYLTFQWLQIFTPHEFPTLCYLKSTIDDGDTATTVTDSADKKVKTSTRTSTIEVSLNILPL